MDSMAEAEKNLTAGEIAYAQIRTDIIFAVLRPDEKLKLEPMRERYQTSITTLREVLNRLSSEGFVIAVGQKGFRVAPVSLKGLTEVAELRQLVECHALRASIANGGIDWEAAVISSHHKLAAIESQMIEGQNVDVIAWKTLDRDFHSALIAACGSQMLLRLFDDVFDHYVRYQRLVLGFRGQEAADEHLALMKSAIARNADEAVRVLIKHMRKGVEHAVTRGALAERAEVA
jgi:DNA-binding GntR family transcriptional regulator